MAHTSVAWARRATRPLRLACDVSPPGAAGRVLSAVRSLPALLRRGRLTVTVSTAGHSPAIAAWLRDHLAGELGEEYDALIGVLADVRNGLRAEGRSTEGLDWRRALDSGILDLVRAGRLEDAKERVSACLSSSSD